MADYLTPDDPGAFIDHPMMEPRGECTQPCAKCKGHGGWNLKPFAYQLRAGMQNTAANRHKHVHFRAMCGACWGAGFVMPGQCPHEWEVGRAIGNCLHIWKCTKCGVETQVDSSD